MERPFDIGPGPKEERINLDLLAIVDNRPIGIELKYWKKGAEIDVNGERFVLKNQAAQDISRYDFWWDVSRLERLRAAGEISPLYTVLEDIGQCSKVPALKQLLDSAMV